MLPYKLPNANATVVTATSTAATLQTLINAASGTTAINLPAQLDSCDLMVEGANGIRILYDGNTPTTTKGILVAQNKYISLRGVDLDKVKLIAASGTTLVSVQIGKETVKHAGVNYFGS